MVCLSVLPYLGLLRLVTSPSTCLSALPYCSVQVSLTVLSVVPICVTLFRRRGVYVPIFFLAYLRYPIRNAPRLPRTRFQVNPTTQDEASNRNTQS